MIFRKIRKNVPTDLSHDAWGLEKVSIAHSMFHSLFSYDIPNSIWLELIDGVEQISTGINATSNNHRLNIVGAIGKRHTIKSKRHPRYQPNRGIHYSNSMILPSDEAIGIRRWGMFNEKYGFFFELKDGSLYAVKRTTINNVTIDTSELISNNRSLTPNNGDEFTIDLTRGNIFDIQGQWRGAGIIKFFIGEEGSNISRLVYELHGLGSSSELSTGIPALNASYEVIGSVTLQSGCVDITSENGFKENRTYRSYPTGEISLGSTETPVVAWKINKEFLGHINTRDNALRRITGFADDNAVVRIYATRDENAITTTWSDIYEGDTSISIDGAITNIDTSLMNRIHEERIPANSTQRIDNPDEDFGDLFMTAGDYLLITMEAKNATLGGATLEWGAEI